MIIHKLRFDEDDKRIVPDGGIVRVAVAAMDSTQQTTNRPAKDERVQGYVADMKAQLRDPNLDQRVRDSIESNLATLDVMKRNADRAAAWSDHFTAQTQAQADGSAYGQYCQQISDAWKQVAA